MRDNSTKDTLDNVREVPEVVINIVNYELVEQMSLSSTEYEKGSTIFRAEVTSAIENCPVCGSWQTIRKKGFKERMLRLVEAFFFLPRKQ